MTMPVRQVLLVHGMGRSAASMMLLSHRLRAVGYRTHLFNYYVSIEPIAAIVERLVRFAGHTMHGPFAAIGHSLGGILVRAGQAELTELGLQQLVMLGPPNNPPTLARLLHKNPAFRLLTGDAGQKLSDAQFYAALPPADIPTLVVAGKSGPTWPFGDASDGVVSVQETRLPGAQHAVVPGLHTFLMNDRHVTKQILQFLQHNNVLATHDRL